MTRKELNFNLGGMNSLLFLPSVKWSYILQAGRHCSSGILGRIIQWDIRAFNCILKVIPGKNHKINKEILTISR